MDKLFANSEDPEQTCSVVSDLGLHCLPITLLGVSRLQWVNKKALLIINHKDFCGEIRKKLPTLLITKYLIYCYEMPLSVLLHCNQFDDTCLELL